MTNAAERTHAFTVDVEDYYSVIARDRLGIDGPPTQAVVRNTETVLSLLAEAGDTRATFFILGEVAETFPQLMRRIADAGHEIGVHGYRHRQFFKLTPEQARSEVGDARKLLQDLSGQVADGHRAPAFSIRPDTQWALEVLAELGFRYDSSIYPIEGRRYGWPDFPERIHRMELPSGASLIEAPPATTKLMGRRLPACGGGYLRHFPYWYTGRAMRQIARERPAVVYMHPYEIDVDPPDEAFARAMAAAPRPVRRFHAVQLRNRQSVRRKLARLLRDFRFAPLRDVIDTVLRDQSDAQDRT